ncbi:UDP-N-acetylglucosamine transferase subunit ALG13 [Nocardioides daedukensis]|uniref:UDP-N-acetylglucosamine transferase subunit ALG13 n=1 Tax=Nocardioides daedukensis TaxID=634462 RepID=A0A7Y9S571_9ACTN|nr:glycosyltransferase [Nocardioides daedukensis]NYG60263.1 UDP-N-acetylglucosamine transferase subunit ALG13 [Nocardioides daedukensis]
MTMLDHRRDGTVPSAAPTLEPAPGTTAGITADPCWIRPGRTLLVTSNGGHLEQMLRLRPRFLPQLDDVEWATFDTPQSRHLLSGETVHHIPFVRPKDLRGTVLNSTAAARLLGGDHHRFTRVVSTGAAVAIPFLARARALGLAAHYIESAARSEGSSVSGSVVSRIPGVRLYGQYPGWTAGRWQFRGSVLDGFAPGSQRSPRPIDKVVVTFGTQRDFGFRRAAERLVSLLPDVCTTSPTILWQTGATDTNGLRIPAVESVPANVLVDAVAEADLVISHSGVGTALLTLEHGKCPVMLPRRSDLGEHTDDHQRLIAMELGRRGLAVWSDPDDLTAEGLHRAALMTAVRDSAPPRFLLQPD